MADGHAERNLADCARSKPRSKTLAARPSSMGSSRAGGARLAQTRGRSQFAEPRPYHAPLVGEASR